MLATYGVDENGDLYIHMKVYKQKRIFGEFYFTGGIVKLHCRECFRWHKIVFKPRNQAILVQDSTPAALIENR